MTKLRFQLLRAFLVKVNLEKRFECTKFTMCCIQFLHIRPYEGKPQVVGQYYGIQVY